MHRKFGGHFQAQYSRSYEEVEEYATRDAGPNGSLDLNGLTQMEHNNTPSIGSILEQLLEEDEIQLTQESEQEGNREIYNSTWRQSGTD